MGKRAVKDRQDANKAKQKGIAVNIRKSPDLGDPVDPAGTSDGVVPTETGSKTVARSTRSHAPSNNTPDPHTKGSTPTSSALATVVKDTALTTSGRPIRDASRGVQALFESVTLRSVDEDDLTTDDNRQTSSATFNDSPTYDEDHDDSIYLEYEEAQPRTASQLLQGGSVPSLVFDTDTEEMLKKLTEPVDTKAKKPSKGLKKVAVEIDDDDEDEDDEGIFEVPVLHLFTHIAFESEPFTFCIDINSQARGARSVETVSSNITLYDLKEKIATALNIHSSSLHAQYRISIDTNKNMLPYDLASHLDLNNLIALTRPLSVPGYLANGKRSTRKLKPFTVLIFNKGDDPYGPHNDAKVVSLIYFGENH